MRIAAIPDVHGNLHALRAALADIRRRGGDRIGNLGDIASGPRRPEATVDLPMDQPARTIRGKRERQRRSDRPATKGDADRHARANLRQERRTWIAARPAQAVSEHAVLLCHGTSGNDLHDLPRSVSTMVAAASIPAASGCRPSARAIRIRLSCSAGLPPHDMRCSRRGSGTWPMDLLAVDHDPGPASPLAQDRGCGDWADALRDGHLPG